VNRSEEDGILLRVFRGDKSHPDFESGKYIARFEVALITMFIMS
jgi:hypothetical protein